VRAAKRGKAGEPSGVVGLVGAGWSSRTRGGLGRIQVVPLDRAAKSEVGGWKFGQILVADYETFSKFLRLYL
jgi:hypothetical protein